MNKTRIFIMTFLVAALAVGCTKEKSGRFYIFAENFQNGQTGKVAFDPANINTTTEWVVGEYVSVDGTNWIIRQDEGDDYYLNVDPGVSYNPDGVTAIYPSYYHDNYDVSINGTTMTIDSLTIKFRNDGKQEMAFPMVAKGSGAKPNLEFKHITGGLKLTLKTTAGTMDVHTLKVVAKSNTAAENLTVNDITAKWAVQGPSVPSGSVGGSDEDRDVKYSSEMNFKLQDGDNAYFTIGTSGKTFCVPITISKVDKITVIGYDADGFEVFRKTSTLGSTAPVEANKMYVIPNIVIN